MSNLLVLVVHRLGHKRMPTTWTTTNSTQLAPEGFIYVQKKWLVTCCFVFLFVFFPSFFMVQKYTTGSTQQNTRLFFPYSNKTPCVCACVRSSTSLHRSRAVTLWVRLFDPKHWSKVVDKDRGRGQQVNLQVCVQGRLAPEIFKQKKKFWQWL